MKEVNVLLTQQIILISGAFLGFLGVAAGSFGAHILKTKLSPHLLEVFEVAVRYQMLHAVALIGIVVLLGLSPSLWFEMAGWLFINGVFIFSGSLYLLIMTEVRAWGAVTPVGGLLLLFGWLSLLIGGFFYRSI